MMEAPEWRIPPRRATTAFPDAKPRLYRQAGSYDRQAPVEPARQPRPRPVRERRTKDRRGPMRPLTPAEQAVLAHLTTTTPLTLKDLRRLMGKNPRYPVHSLARRRLVRIECADGQRRGHGREWRVYRR